MSETEKKRGRPKVIKEEKEKKERGRPKTDKPLSERRKLYDLKFSLKKLNTSDEDINKIIEYINKLNADRVVNETNKEKMELVINEEEKK
jgi:hypothetical protein